MCVVVVIIREGNSLEKIGMLDNRCAFPILNKLIDGEVKSDQNLLMKFVTCWREKKSKIISLILIKSFVELLVITLCDCVCSVLRLCVKWNNSSLVKIDFLNVMRAIKTCIPNNTNAKHANCLVSLEVGISYENDMLG